MGARARRHRGPQGKRRWTARVASCGSRNPGVFSAGNPQAPLALVGEQPGDVEDRQGIPFVGPAGRLLQEALEEAGRAQEDVYVTNAVKHFRFTERGSGEFTRHLRSPTSRRACPGWKRS